MPIDPKLSKKLSLAQIRDLQMLSDIAGLHEDECPECDDDLCEAGRDELYERDAIQALSADIEARIVDPPPAPDDTAVTRGGIPVGDLVILGGRVRHRGEAADTAVAPVAWPNVPADLVVMRATTAPFSAIDQLKKSVQNFTSKIIETHDALLRLTETWEERAEKDEGFGLHSRAVVARQCARELRKLVSGEDPSNE